MGLNGIHGCYGRRSVDSIALFDERPAARLLMGGRAKKPLKQEDLANPCWYLKSRQKVKFAAAFVRSLLAGAKWTIWDFGRSSAVVGLLGLCEQLPKKSRQHMQAPAAAP